MENQTSDNSREIFSLADAGFLVYMSGMRSAADSASEILEKIGNDIGESDSVPLQFHLAIFYLAVGAKTVMATAHIEQNFKYRILDHSVEFYFKDLEEFSADPKNAVDAERFVKDPEERQLFLDKMHSFPIPALQNTNRLPLTPLSQIASLFFDRRMREYQDLWNSDWQRKGGPNFFPRLPGKVFQHWTGKDGWSREGMMFSLVLWMLEISFYSSLYDQFRDIEITNNQ